MEHSGPESLFLIIVGGILISTVWLRSEVRRIRIPPLVTFLILGILIRLGDDRIGLLSTHSRDILDFLARLGLVFLLFRVGLESNLQALLRQLRRASLVWLGDVIISGLIGFAAAHYILHLSWITSLVVGTALTATSVGISVAVWQQSSALDSSNGQLLIDVAELDDISAVVLMGLLFSLLPVLQDGGGSGLLPVLGKTGGIFLLKLSGFGAVCLLYARFAERPVTRYFKELACPSDPMLVMVAIGLSIAALADIMGFSIAIGAFLAGLVFCRDPEAVKMESSIMPLYELFTPFFFIGIGMDIAPDQVTAALDVGIVLLFAAMAGKLLGDGVTVWGMAGAKSGLLIGMSMVPRAEIAMVIMQRALEMGKAIMPDDVFGAMVFVSAATCSLSPLIVRPLLARWPQHSASQEKSDNGTCLDPVKPTG